MFGLVGNIDLGMDMGLNTDDIYTHVQSQIHTHIRTLIPAHKNVQFHVDTHAHYTQISTPKLIAHTSPSARDRSNQILCVNFSGYGSNLGADHSSCGTSLHVVTFLKLHKCNAECWGHLRYSTHFA